MRRFVRDNALSLITLALFVAALLGLSLAGHRTYVAELAERGEAAVGYFEYLRTGHFLESVFENWESEFLQMGIYVLLTALVIQKGSAESRQPGEQRERPRHPRYRGLREKVYENSLSIVFLLLFVASFAGHAVGGMRVYNEEHPERPLDLLGYISTPRFWFESFQNWQSEFLAILAIVVLSIFLRQRGSPESKPVES